MKKHFLAIALSLAPHAAHAETFVCTFTEPFASFKYSTGTQTLVLESAGERARTIGGVRFQIADASRFILKAADGKILATLSLTGKGTDGASDRVYPFEVETSLVRVPGACVSTLLKSRE